MADTFELKYYGFDQEREVVKTRNGYSDRHVKTIIQNLSSGQFGAALTESDIFNRPIDADYSSFYGRIVKSSFAKGAFVILSKFTGA